MVNGMRAVARMTALRAPATDSMKRKDMMAGPYEPRKVPAAFAATGSASRWAVEFEVRISWNGSAQKYATFAKPYSARTTATPRIRLRARFRSGSLTSPATMGM